MWGDDSCLRDESQEPGSGRLAQAHLEGQVATLQRCHSPGAALTKPGVVICKVGDASLEEDPQGGPEAGCGPEVPRR